MDTMDTMEVAAAIIQATTILQATTQTVTTATMETATTAGTIVTAFGRTIMITTHGPSKLYPHFSPFSLKRLSEIVPGGDSGIVSLLCPELFLTRINTDRLMGRIK
jgi:hypothetical protein